PEALAGQYGTFTFNVETGAWTYALENDAVQWLQAGVQVTDTLTVSAVDGTEKAIVVTITGTNDAAGITGTATGTVTEDDSLTTGGTPEVTDVDDAQPAAPPIAPEALAGQYGTFTFNTETGAWTYALDND